MYSFIENMQKNMRSEIVQNMDNLLALLTKLIAEYNCSIYDVEFPTKTNGIVRIYITSTAQEKIDPSETLIEINESLGTKSFGASLDICAKVARAILEADFVEELIPGECTLEVSSPGINRKLKTQTHFIEAIGENVKVSLQKLESNTRNKYNKGVFTGKIINFESSTDSLYIEDENLKTVVCLPLSEIKEARIDYNFL